MDIQQIQTVVQHQLDIHFEKIKKLLDDHKHNVVDFELELKTKYPTGWLTTKEFSTECKIGKEAILSRIRSGTIKDYSQKAKGTTILIHVNEVIKALTNNKTTH